MITRQLSTTLAQSAILVAGSVFGAWLLAAPPAGALSDTQQILSGGKGLSEGVTQWTSPGYATTVGTDFPGPGLGESAVQLRMSAGVLSALRVRLTLQNPPTSGTFTLTVRVNGVDTPLTCQLANTGECNAVANVTIANNAKLAIRVTNDILGTGGSMGFSYTLLYN